MRISQHLSHSSSADSESNESEFEDDMDLFDEPLQQVSTLDPCHDFAIIGDSIVAYSQKMFLELQLSNQIESDSRRWGIKHQTKDMTKNESTDVIDEHAIPIRRHFACPFYIRNPERHLKCFTTADLLDIKDVKKHLWNTHRLQPYCPTCGETFATTTKSDTHIRSRLCNRRDVPRPEGISLQQMQQLARRAEVWMSEDLQWLCLWEIVFPGAEWPNFTYPSRTVEFIVCRFRDYWSCQGETIIYDFLQEKGFHDDNLGGEKPNLVALHALILHQAIDHLVEAFENDDDYTPSTKVEEVLASLQCSQQGTMGG
ncbi:hypothetical protein F4806DRAFT_460234 [Annulohypoxylon nitens]|nr:hypothetical protein F4806DRAFT_460234 [Annulohypoxylon nitens]